MGEGERERGGGERKREAGRDGGEKKEGIVSEGSSILL